MERDSLSEDTWTGSRVRSFRNGKRSHRYSPKSSSPTKSSSLARTGVKRRVEAFRRSLRDITRRDDKLLRGSRTTNSQDGGLSPTLRNSINEVSQELDFAMSDINKRAGYRPRSSRLTSSFTRSSNTSLRVGSSYDGVSDHLRRLRESVDRRVRAIDEVRDEVRTDRVDHLGEKMQKLVEQSGAIVSELEVDMAAKVSLLRDSVKRRMEAIERIQIHGDEDAKNEEEGDWRYSSYRRSDDVEDRVETRAAELLMKPKMNSLVEIDARSSSDEERDDNDDATYLRGDRVEARHNGRWRRARIVRVRRDDNKCDIRWSRDGRVKRDVRFKNIRHERRKYRRGRRRRRRRRMKKLSVGQRVEAHDHETSRWRAAEVITVHSNETITVKFDVDETKEDPIYRKLDKRKIRIVGFEADQIVEARYKGERKWIRGRITKVHVVDQTYDVSYDNGESELRVPRHMIRKEYDDDDYDRSRDDEDSDYDYYSSDDDRDSLTYSLSSSQDSFDTQRRRLRRRRVRGRRDDEDENVRFDRSFEEADVDSNGEEFSFFAEGTRVEARYKRREEWRDGRIVKQHSDRTYDVVYKNGKLDRRLPERYVRRRAHTRRGRRGRRRRRRRRGGRYRDDMMFEEDDIIEARYEGKALWVRGRIDRVRHDDGTYDIRYDNGEREARVEYDLIRFVRFEIGDIVEARMEGADRWEVAEVLRRHDTSGTLDVRFQGGKEIERRVPLRRVRPCSLRKSTTLAHRTAYVKGSDIEARFEGRREWWRGRVTRVNRDDGTYDIRYDNGEEELEVHPTMMRPRMRKGAPVMARFQGRKRWFPGKITRVHGDGSFDVVYNDGDKDTRLDADFVRPLRFEKNDRVEAKRRGKTWLPARVSHVCEDGSYDVIFEDGNEETGLEVENLRYVRFFKGERVRARFGGGKKFRAAQIVSVHEDNTYDIREERDEGDIERHVHAGSIRRAQRQFKRDATVEARFEGGHNWRTGRVHRLNSDGTVDIKYDDDGNIERGVTSDLVRMKFLCGDFVEARFEARKRLFAGVITRVNDGTYDIKYDDGDRERDVQARMIGFLRFDVDEDVEVRRKGSQRFDRGVVLRVHENEETLDVKYEDGEVNRRVHNRYVRRREGSNQKSFEPEHFEKGEEIEARFEGRKRWFRGVILRANDNETYDIRYEDGDKERNVDSDLVRRVPYAKGDHVEARDKKKKNIWVTGKILRRDDENGTYEVDLDDGDVRTLKRSEIRHELKRGSSVFARHGKDRWWRPGTISIVHDDDSFDVRFRDETVAKALSRKNVRGRVVTFRVESSVEIRMHSKDWKKAVITRVRDDGTYDVRFEASKHRFMSNEEEDEETNVERCRIRYVLFNEGDRVEARHGGRNRWYAGSVLKAHDDATYQIEFDDGDVEDDVPHHHVRYRVLVGASVHAKGGLRPDEWRSGRVAASHNNGLTETFDVQFRDGDKALRMSREQLQSLSTMRTANDALKKVSNNIVSTLEGTILALEEQFREDAVVVSNDVMSNDVAPLSVVTNMLPEVIKNKEDEVKEDEDRDEKMSSPLKNKREVVKLRDGSLLVTNDISGKLQHISKDGLVSSIRSSAAVATPRTRRRVATVIGRTSPYRRRERLVVEAEPRYRRRRDDDWSSLRREEEHLRWELDSRHHRSYFPEERRRRSRRSRYDHREFLDDDSDDYREYSEYLPHEAPSIVMSNRASHQEHHHTKDFESVMGNLDRSARERIRMQKMVSGKKW